MTDDSPTGKATRSARREANLRALGWLWSVDDKGRHNSTLSRVRACRLNASDAQAGVTLRRMADGSARWVGLQSCGSTWACPVCADRVQKGRKAEVAAMIDAAHRLGLVVAFLTFTVRHQRTQSLREVWDEVADAWRMTTSGGSGANQRAWRAAQDEYGVVGYLRLWEATHGAGAGWHVHVHALLFLDPNGREVITRELVPLVDADDPRLDYDFIGPEPAVDDFGGPRGVGRLLPGQQRRLTRLVATSALARVRHGVADDASWADQCSALEGPKPIKVKALPGLRGAWRRPEGPLPAPVLVEDARKATRTGPEVRTRIPSRRALVNAHVDGLEGRPARPGLYRRDVVALGEWLAGRWRAALPANMAPPAVCGDQGHACVERRRREAGPHQHGWDVRIVDDVDVLSDYFTKNVLTVKGVESAAWDVTSSTTKLARVGNRTPFGILADLVDGTSADDVDDEGNVIAGSGVARDRALWREWEAVSKGRRQLRPSTGLRAALGLVGDEATDADLAGDDVAQVEDVDVLTLEPAQYRAVARSGDAAWSLELAEAGDYALVRDLLAVHIGYLPDDDPVPIRRVSAFVKIA